MKKKALFIGQTGINDMEFITKQNINKEKIEF